MYATSNITRRDCQRQTKRFNTNLFRVGNHIVSVQVSAARPRHQLAPQYLEDGCLPGAVNAEQTEARSGGHGHCDVVHGEFLAGHRAGSSVVLIQVLYDDGVVAHLVMLRA